MRATIELFVASDMLRLPPEADKVTRQIHEEKCYEKRRKEIVNSGIRTITASAGLHADGIWEAAASWCVNDDEDGGGTLQLPPTVHGVDWSVPFLEHFGYVPRDAEYWFTTPGTGGYDAELHLKVRDHEEHAGHTWYMIECELIPRGWYQPRQGSAEENDANPFRGLKWMAPRRLMHLREILQEPLLELLEKDYTSKFSATPFPLRMAPPGTTARLHDWLQTLAREINTGAMVPQMVAWSLFFFFPFANGRLPRAGQSQPTVLGAVSQLAPLSSSPSDIGQQPSADRVRGGDQSSEDGPMKAISHGYASWEPAPEASPMAAAILRDRLESTARQSAATGSCSPADAAAEGALVAGGSVADETITLDLVEGFDQEDGSEDDETQPLSRQVSPESAPARSGIQRSEESL